MVDPASSSSSTGQQQQQQQNTAPVQPPTLSITVVPLDPLDMLDDLPSSGGGGGDAEGGGGHGVDQNDEGDSSCDASGLLSRQTQHNARPLSEAALLRLSQNLYDEVVDEVVLGIVFEEHRGAKLGLTALLEMNGTNGGNNGDTQSDFDGADETSNSGSRTFPIGDGGDGDGGLFEKQYPLPSSAAAAAEVLAAAAAALIKRPAECVCPNCQRNMAASRFAPHLEKCMGMGRNSSRLASRRIASSATRQADLVSDDDVDDDDWSADRHGGGVALGGDGSGGSGGAGHGGNGGSGGGSGSGGNKNGRRRHKKDKNSPRRKKWKHGSDSGGNGGTDAMHDASAPAAQFQHLSAVTQSSAVLGLAERVNPSSAAEAAALAGIGGVVDATTISERQQRLSTMCGVVSEHTGKMCTRSLRCPQHSDSQRKGVRAALLLSSSSVSSSIAQPGGGTTSVGQLLAGGTTLTEGKDNNSSKEMIDVDTWDEQGDSLASLLTAQSHDVPTPGAEASPAESTSTSASSTSSSARRPSTGSNRPGGKTSKSGKNNNNKRLRE